MKKKADPIWHEGHPYPRDVDYMVADTLESLRPKLTMFTNLEEAIESLETLNKEHQEQIGANGASLLSVGKCMTHKTTDIPAILLIKNKRKILE